jgi:hypothetical protein
MDFAQGLGEAGGEFAQLRLRQGAVGLDVRRRSRRER